MNATQRTPVDLRLNRARILFTRWQCDDVVEGYVREFSPDGMHVRISLTPADKDKGRWWKAAELRCVEVLELNFDFKAWNEREKARRRREREGDISGEEWKYPDADGDPEGSTP